MFIAACCSKTRSSNGSSNALAVWNDISGSRRLDGDAVFGDDGHDLSHFRHAGGGRGVQFPKHLIKAATRREAVRVAVRVDIDAAFTVLVDLLK